MAVKQINNLLALLEFFAKRQSPATLADVTTHFDWPRSSAFNILTTLVETGYLFEPRARGGFYPSPRWSQVIGAISEAEPLPELLSRILQSLARSTGETVWVSAPSGLFAVFLEVIESKAPVRYAAEPGKRVPIHVTASGQALLAQMPPRDVEVLLNRAQFGCWGANAPRMIDEVYSEMARAGSRGWFRSASNYSPDLGGVALPIALNDRTFSITVAGPLFRVADKADEHAAQLRAAIEEELGAEYVAGMLRNMAERVSAGKPVPGN